jgi:hypothetical protein
LRFFAKYDVNAQENAAPEVLNETTVRIIPTSFYFAGQSAPTQMRNSAAAGVGKKRYIVARLVDTSADSTEISGKYEGFFINDSPSILAASNSQPELTASNFPQIISCIFSI